MVNTIKEIVLLRGLTNNQQIARTIGSTQNIKAVKLNIQLKVFAEGLVIYQSKGG